LEIQTGDGVSPLRTALDEMLAFEHAERLPNRGVAHLQRLGQPPDIQDGPRLELIVKDPLLDLVVGFVGEGRLEHSGAPIGGG
jgi:hypothetical protein